MATNIMTMAYYPNLINEMDNMLQAALHSQANIMQYIEKKGAVGYQMEDLVKTGRNADAGAKAEGRSYTYDRTTWTKPYLSWHQYSVGFGKSKEAVIHTDMNPNTIFRNWIQDIASNLDDLMNDLNNDMIAGTGSSYEMYGLVTAIDDTSTYANIDPASVTAWASYVNSNGGVNRALTESLLDTVYKTMLNRGTFSYGKPAIFTSINIAGIIEGLAQSYQSATISADNKNYIMNWKTPLTNLYYRGIPIIPVRDGDSGGTNKLANTMLLTNLDDWVLYYPRLNVMNVGDKLDDFVSIQPITTTTATFAYELYTHFCFMLKNRFRQCKVEDISE